MKIKAGKIPNSLRLEESVEFCEEENIIRRFVNGDINIYGFMYEMDVIYGQTQSKDTYSI